MSSRTELTASDGLVTSTFGDAANRTTGAKSRNVSYGSCLTRPGSPAFLVHTISSVSPAGVASAASSVPVVVPPAGRLLIITCLPQLSESEDPPSELQSHV